MSLSAVRVDIVVEGDVVLHSRQKWTMRLVAVQKVGKIDHVCVLIEQFFCLFYIKENTSDVEITCRCCFFTATNRQKPNPDVSHEQRSCRIECQLKTAPRLSTLDSPIDPRWENGVTLNLCG